MRIEAETLSGDAAHQLLKGCVMPRPIAWVSTLGSNGVANAAPYSCFTFLATRPPMLGFSVELRNGEKKDTLLNIEHTGDFVVNAVPEGLAEAMNTTADNYPPDASEIEAVGLTVVPGERVQAPRIAECPISMECRVVDVIKLGESRHCFVIGEVVLFHIRDDLYHDGEIDPQLLRPLGRLSGNYYVRLGETLELDRPWLRTDEPTQ